MRNAAVILTACIAVFVAGCQGPEPITKKDSLVSIRLEKKQLECKLAQADAENQSLKKQITTLTHLEPSVELDNLNIVEKVSITEYTNIYDKDKDGKKEKLLVYIQPTDRDGDTIKAAASIYVQLWNLNKDQQDALLAKWRVEPEELRKLWFSAILGTNYRLAFDVSDIVKEYKDPLTVKIVFTDYLTGKVFKEQKVIKP